MTNSISAHLLDLQELQHRPRIKQLISRTEAISMSMYALKMSTHLHSLTIFVKEKCKCFGQFLQLPNIQLLDVLFGVCKILWSNWYISAKTFLI